LSSLNHMNVVNTHHMSSFFKIHFNRISFHLLLCRRSGPLLSYHKVYTRCWATTQLSMSPAGPDLRLTTLVRTSRDRRRQTRPLITEDVT
jgi:hypothetical protein